MASCQDKNWEDLQFEYVDWNDIVEAELNGDTDALLQLRKKSDEVKRLKTQTLLPLRSYAEVVSPLQHGVKRSISDRTGLSPIECCRKRSSVRYEADSCQRFSEQQTPPNTVLSYTDENSSPETPDSIKGVQRRLFPSPNTGQLTPTRHSPDHEVLTPHRLEQRQKQIDFGKNTIGYQKYIQTVPRWERKSTHPVTPDKLKVASTRAWQGQIRVWRRALHKFDPPTKHEDAFTPMEASLCQM